MFRGCHAPLALQWTPVDTKLLAGGGEVVGSPWHCLSLQQKLSDHSPSMGLTLISLLMWLSQVYLSNLLLQIISSLLVLLLFLVRHSSFCNNEMIWKKGGLVCQPAMLTGMKCHLSPLHTSLYTFTRESFPSDVFVFFSCLSINSDTAPWMSENYKC